MLSIVLSSLGHNVELSTGDLRQGTAFDSVKATFSQNLQLGELPASKLRCEYDSGSNRDFLKEASLTGSIIEPKEAKAAKGRQAAVDASDLSVTYEVSHDFASKKTDVKLSANTKFDGTKLGAEFDDTDGLTEVSAERDLDLGDDMSVNVQPSWLVKAKTARVKLMSKLGGEGKISATVDYTPDNGDTAYEVSYDHSIESGRDITASFGGDNVEIDYVDSKTEDGATWTASASVPVDSNNILDAAKLSLKRAWTW